MKRYITFFSILCATLLIAGCGDDDSPETPQDEGPKVVSVTPEDGATEVPVGTVNISVGYNQTIYFTSANANQLQITGGTIVSARAMGSALSIVADCPDKGTTISITIPAGLVKGPTQAPAEAFTFSFTTKKAFELDKSRISKTPLTNNLAAVKLYLYMLEQYGQKTLSSVMANVNWNNECADKVYKLTGKYPAMNCYDFIHICYSPANWIDYTNIKPVQDWVNAGGLVQLMWHFNVPKSEGATDYTCTPSETTFRASNIFVDGTWENKWFYQQMDKVIDTLLKLQEAGIAATWRPFHEAAGNATLKSGASWGKAWFWWGYDGAEVYKQLWVTMYDYFKQKGVDNLIWVWTTQNYNGDSQQFAQDIDWYPGDQYVDIVGRDLYGEPAEANAREFQEVAVTYPTKMVALAECGQGNGNQPGLISQCQTAGALWSHFMVWYQGGQGSTETMCSDAWWKDAMSCPDVITRDEVPNLKQIYTQQ